MWHAKVAAFNKSPRGNKQTEHMFLAPRQETNLQARPTTTHKPGTCQMSRIREEKGG